MEPNKPDFLQKMTPWASLQAFGKQIKIMDDCNVFFFESGKNQSKHLLLIHGLGDEADTWRHVFVPLSEKIHVVALDLPGFGRSDKPKVDYSPPFMMDAIIGLMNQLEIQEATIIGSSLGAILAHGITVTRPERVKSLILVGGALLQPKPSLDLSLRLMQVPFLGEWFYTKLRTNPQAAFDSLKNVYYKLSALPKEDQEFLFTRVNQRVWSDDQRRAYFSTLRNMIPWLGSMQKSLPQQLSAVSTPTLLIRGEFDSLYPEANADQLISIQPKTTKTTIKNSGHLPHQEQPKFFLEAINSWIEQST